MVSTTFNNNEVILISTKEDNSIFLYDLRNGTLQSTYHGGCSELNGMCLIGNEYFVASQTGKALLHFYSWRKDQPLYKTPIQERAGPMTATSDSNYVVMGTSSGSIYIWESSTGALLRVWEAHFSKITSLAFTKDDGFLLSGGEDGVINCWSLESILDKEQTVLRVKQSFSDHSLNITAIHCGYGGINSRFYSVSLDRTCRVWDLIQGRSIGSIVFPTYLTSIVVDATETTVYVGGGDGVIYQTDLINLNQSSTNSSYDSTNNNNNNNQSSSFVTQTSNEMTSQLKKTFLGHNKPVTTLSLSMDGSLLVSGATDGSVSIWDTFSRQIVRSISNLKGSISSIIVTMKPIDLLNMNMSGDSRKNYDPIQPFEKYISPVGEKPSTQIKLKQINIENDLSNELYQQSYNPFKIDLNLSLHKSSTPSSTSSSLKVNNSNNNVNNEEINKLKAEIEQLKQVNKNLLDRIVTQTVNEGDVMPSVATVKQQLTKMKQVTEKATKNIAKAAEKASKAVAPIVEATNNKTEQQPQPQPKSKKAKAAAKLKDNNNPSPTTTQTVPKKKNPIKETIITTPKKEENSKGYTKTTKLASLR